MDNNGTPPAGNPVNRCSVADVAKAPAYPRLSPDGTQVTWQDEDGIYVAPVADPDRWWHLPAELDEGR